MVIERATITMAAAANLLRGGGVVLLWSSSSCCSCLYSTTTSCCSQSLNLSLRRRLPSPRPYLKRLTTSHSSLSTTASRRRSLFSSFCTATNDSASSASPSPPPPTTTSSTNPSSSQEEEEEEDPNSKIKEAADLLDIRVGRILKAWRHEEADSLYVEEVDVGEPQPRIICSGLVNYIPLHLLQDARVVVLANLKPRNMRGVRSYGMLMAASDDSHSNVELLVPPEGSIPGDRIWFGPEDHHQHQPPPASPNQIQKKKIWELVQPHLKTDDSCVAMLLGEHVMRTSAGVVLSTCLKNANIS